MANFDLQWCIDHPDEQPFSIYVRGGKHYYPSLKQRFLNNCNEGADDECWLWTGKKGTWQGKIPQDGHGLIFVMGKSIGSSRVAFLLQYGWLPPVVLHTCDVPSCVNWHHLRAGTQTDNLRDMVAKGRHWQHTKTHCPQGHPLSGDNLYINEYTGGRGCKECRNAAAREKRANARPEKAYLTREPKTHCRQGHPFEGNNKIVLSNGAQTCRICSNERQRKRRAYLRSLRDAV